MDPLPIVVLVAAAVCAFCWIASLVTKDTSWVDRLWSIVPVVYVWVFAAGSGLSDPRLVVMAVLVTLWGARLTFNFARKGGYSGMEDYRWAILRERMTPAQFQGPSFLLVFCLAAAVEPAARREPVVGAVPAAPPFARTPARFVASHPT
ncbi:MAG: DUF1295 domain-containing protein [Microbacteriaceae bacterium]|nr:MAG: DUF1295 domain-containing protein [Microbacteriaceae bacterium]